MRRFLSFCLRGKSKIAAAFQSLTLRLEGLTIDALYENISRQVELKMEMSR
jgi:hypothetical protein